MRCKVNYQTDPISLIVIAADGKEHTAMDEAESKGDFLQVEIRPTPRAADGGESVPTADIFKKVLRRVTGYPFPHPPLTQAVGWRSAQGEIYATLFGTRAMEYC